jgi:signal transduction histidine kinase
VLELELRDLRAEVGELRRVARLKDQCLAVATHELAAPLTAMKAYIEALSEHYGEPSFTHGPEFLDVLGREMDRLIRVVERTLEISRLASNRSAMLQRQAMSIAEVVKEVAATLRPILDERRIALDVQVAPALARVHGDRDLVKQVVINLVHNAAKFSPPGRAVRVRAVETSDAVEVEVRDEGFGIAPEELGRIFEPFYRSSDERVERQRGTGLGLTIVKAIVEKHDGRVVVESEPDRGTTFRFTLPKV